MSTISWRGWFLIVLIGVMAGVGANLWAHRGVNHDATVRDWNSVIETAYVGDVECARCHVDQAELHAATGHSHTLSTGNLCERFASLIGKEIPDPERPGGFRYECKDGELTVTFTNEDVRTSLPIQFAVGSGKNAVTFLTLLDQESGDPAGLEHRLSLFQQQTHSALTPNHSGLPADQSREFLGRMRFGRDITTCIGCHSTSGQVHGSQVDDLRMGVGCESCHGPGRAHVAAREAGREEADIKFGKGRATTQEEMHLCGRCHRSTDHLQVLPDPENPKLARFQPVGLSQSACFKQSEGALKCSTCHDPHATVDHKHTNDFVAKCQQCHNPANAEQTKCVIEPTGQCITCHMPAVEVHPGIRFHDHWIRKRGENTAAQ
jgi:hypothetical protein